jgi:hypothetical protein
MITFAVLGFIAEGGRYFDCNFNVFAESPVDAVEKALKQHASMVVSSVCRLNTGRLMDY